VSGGRFLNLRCLGDGAITVILDAGGGRFSTAWRKVQGEIAKFARVCSYDRAGYGFSSPNDRPSTAMNIVDDLRQALDRAEIRAPLVLVGHSAGGLYATLYADLHASDVAGLVLVDPAFASQSHDNALAAWSAYPDILAEQRIEQGKGRKLMRECADLARAGKLKAGLGSCPCITTPKDQPELANYVADYCSGPKQYEGMLAEEAELTGLLGEPTSTSNEQEAAVARSFGDMPLTVLTNASGWSYTRSADLNARLTMVWRAGHVGLAARSKRGKVIVVPKSGHTIQGDQPVAVIEAVREVVDAVRAAHPNGG
jgi:pimeloyl-ACP methyl ester carboxylesterase